MAIISIPTSIGGVSIPGGFIQGPLASLFENKGTQIMQYPSDLLASPTRSHAVMFTRIDIDPAKMGSSTETALTGIGSLLSGDMETAKGLAKESLDSATNTTLLTKLKPTHDKIVSHINLYMPDTLSMKYSSSYDEFSLTDNLGTIGRIGQAGMDAINTAMQTEGGWQNKLKNVLSSAVKGPGGLEAGGNVLGGALGVKNGGDMLLRAGGYAVNPQLQLMYKGIALRDFSLEFLFTPKSSAESNAVKNIINEFTEAFLPDVRGAVGGNEGQYFIMPSIFRIAFKIGGNSDIGSAIINNVLGNFGTIGSQIAPLIPGSSAFGAKDSALQTSSSDYLYKVGDCVLTDFDVDYAPNGWVSHSDGAPLQTKLTLTFRETDIMHRGRFKKGKGEVR